MLPYVRVPREGRWCGVICKDTIDKKGLDDAYFCTYNVLPPLQGHRVRRATFAEIIVGSVVRRPNTIHR
jgi:hypothetical protein